MRYEETASYGLRKPTVGTPDSENVWGIDLNRSISEIDTIVKSQEDAISSQATGIDNAETDLDGLVARISALQSTILSYQSRITPYLDNPDCDPDVLTQLGRLDAIIAWCDATITRLQRYISGTYYYSGTTAVRDYDIAYTLRTTFSNGLIKTHSRQTS